MMYLQRSPDRIEIPPTFDPDALRALMRELQSDQGNWPQIADEHSVRVAVQHAASAEEARKIRSCARGPAQILAYARALPDAMWPAGTETWDEPAHLIGRIRGLPVHMNEYSSLRLGPEVETLTDEELDALVAGVASGRIVNQLSLASEPLAARLAARMTDAQLQLVWPRITGPYEDRLLRCLSDAQFVALRAWALPAHRLWRAERERNHPVVHLPALNFEALRRGALTRDELVELLAVVDLAPFYERFNDLLRAPHGLDGKARVQAVRAALVHLRSHAPVLRDWLLGLRQRECADPQNRQVWPVYIGYEGCAFGFAAAWDAEIGAWFGELFLEHVGTLKKDYERDALARTLAEASIAQDDDVVLAYLRKLKGGKRITEMLANAAAQAENHRTAFTGDSERIVWGRTSTAKAVDALRGFSRPVDVIAAGIADPDPVAVLNALRAAMQLHWEQTRTGQPAIAVPPALLIAGVRAIAERYTDAQPDGRELSSRIGVGEILKARRVLGEVLEYWLGRPERAELVPVLLELYPSTSNRRFRTWITELVARLQPGLVADARTRLIDLARECAADPKLGKSLVRTTVLRRGNTQPAPTAVNRLAGAPIGVTEATWPTYRGAPMEHVITVETAALGEQARTALGAEVVAVAVFVSSLSAHQAFAPGTDHSAVVKLRAADLATPAVGDGGRALETISLEVPSRLFQGGKKTGALLELRQMFDDPSLIVPGAAPRWIQQPEPDGTFLFDLDEDFVPGLNLGDAGRLYVFAGSAFAQCH